MVNSRPDADMVDLHQTNLYTAWIRQADPSQKWIIATTGTYQSLWNIRRFCWNLVSKDVTEANRLNDCEGQAKKYILEHRVKKGGVKKKIGRALAYVLHSVGFDLKGDFCISEMIVLATLAEATGRRRQKCHCDMSQFEMSFLGLDKREQWPVIVNLPINFNGMDMYLWNMIGPGTRVNVPWGSALLLDGDCLHAGGLRTDRAREEHLHIPELYNLRLKMRLDRKRSPSHGTELKAHREYNISSGELTWEGMDYLLPTDEVEKRDRLMMELDSEGSGFTRWDRARLPTTVSHTSDPGLLLDLYRRTGQAVFVSRHNSSFFNEDDENNVARAGGVADMRARSRRRLQ